MFTQVPLFHPFIRQDRAIFSAYGQQTILETSAA